MYNGKGCLMLGVSLLVVLAIGSQPAAAQSTGAQTGHATITKPQSRTLQGGNCRILEQHSLGGVWGSDALPLLAFTIGPASAMADQMHASKAPYAGPGQYKNVIVAVYLGKTATENAYYGLGTVTVSSDGHSGSFTLNDGTAAGNWDCGKAPAQ